MQSQVVLDPVIDKLNLNVEWGKKYNNGETLKTTETMEILKQRMGLAPVRNTKLVSIMVYSDDKKEVAQIANAIAESYKDYRVKTAAALAATSLAKLQQQWRQNEKQIEQARTEVNSLHQQLKIGSAISDNPSPQEQSYWDKKQYLDGLLETHKALYSKIKAEEIDAHIPQTTMVMVIDRAEPGKAPVKPNKTLNITFGIVAGIILASAAGGVSVFIVLQFRKRIGKTTATT
jgi:capsular polysaccharide biosynthesis protein